MKFGDALSGLAIVLVGLAIAAYAARFPAMPGQPIGPSAFPMMLGIGLTLLGVALAVAGTRTQRGWRVEFEEWIHQPRMVLNFALTIGSLLFYCFVVDGLGFFITAFLFLAVLFVAFGVRRIWIAPVALAVTVLIHYGFYSLLRVPLPWGVTEAVAW
jgi:putative tricarboxylic transport membrane protein